MEDLPAKAAKEKKKGKSDKKKLKVGDIAQPEESIMPVEPPADEAGAAVEPRAHEAAADAQPRADEAGAGAAAESAREEMKRYKEQLLQSVAENECSKAPSPQRSADAGEEAETRSTLARIRERSLSRAYEAPPPAPSAPAHLLDLDDGKLGELKEAFLLFDLDGDGCISHSDLRGTLISLGQQVDDAEVRKMISEVRINPLRASSPLDFDAFVSLLGRRGVELDPEETLVDALSQWDYAATGLISEERMRHDLVTWGDRFSEREAVWALEEAPTVQKRGDTMIDYIRFCKILCGLRKATKKFNE